LRAKFGAPKLRSRAQENNTDARALVDDIRTLIRDWVSSPGPRKVIARRLTEAKSTIPHFYVSMGAGLNL